MQKIILSTLAAAALVTAQDAPAQNAPSVWCRATATVAATPSCDGFATIYKDFIPGAMEWVDETTHIVEITRAAGSASITCDGLVAESGAGGEHTQCLTDLKLAPATPDQIDCVNWLGNPNGGSTTINTKICGAPEQHDCNDTYLCQWGNECLVHRCVKKPVVQLLKWAAANGFINSEDDLHKYLGLYFNILRSAEPGAFSLQQDAACISQTSNQSVTAEILAWYPDRAYVKFSEVLPPACATKLTTGANAVTMADKTESDPCDTQCGSADCLCQAGSACSTTAKCAVDLTCTPDAAPATTSTCKAAPEEPAAGVVASAALAAVALVAAFMF